MIKAQDNTVPFDAPHSLGSFKKRTDVPQVAVSTHNEEPAVEKPLVYESRPTVKNQLIKYPDSVKVIKAQTFIFDLSKAEDLERYNYFSSASLDVDSGVLIQEKEKQFYNGTWLVYITVAYLHFTNLLK